MVRNTSVDVEALTGRIRSEGAECMLTRREAAALIAARVMDAHDSPRGSRNRIAMKLVRASLKGSDFATGGIETSDDGRFTVDEIARWATREFGDLFPDLPRKEGRVFSNTMRDGVGLASKPSSFRLPGSVDECHAGLLRFKQELEELHKAVREDAKNRAASTYARFGK